MTGNPLHFQIAKDLVLLAAVEDSGKREDLPTGSVRDTRIGKGRYDLISPIALKPLARHYEAGAKKYGDRNWEKGQPLSRYLDSAMRHLVSFLGGDRSEDHLSACSWNCFAYVHTLEMIEKGVLPRELDDTGEIPSFASIQKPPSEGRLIHQSTYV
jgi:hypothetical protein